MIKTKKDYKEYLEADRKALRMKNNFKDYFFHDIWRFQRFLRRIEYYQNCKKGIFNKIILYITKYRYKKLALLLGFSISPNVFGKGLEIGHYGDIVVNGNARVGENCCINSGVCIGEVRGKTPVIGDNVYIGPGAKILGDIKVASGVTIAANSVVVKDVLEPNITIGGITAKKISK